MRVLIVEDDMVIAGGLGPVVTDAGHDLVGLAADRNTAVALLNSTGIDLALVDLHLADGWTGVEVVRAASENGVAAVFTTANAGLLPADLAGAGGLILKPYAYDQMKRMLDFIEAKLANRPAGATPPGLELGPRWTGPKAASGQSNASNTAS